jgi:hypothetical protein
MNGRRALLCALLFASGCMSADGKGFFDDALKDLRGDNMQMRSDSSLLKEPSALQPPSMDRR